MTTRNTQTSQIQGIEITIKHIEKLELVRSADPRANKGKSISRYTSVFVNNESMCSIPGWINIESAFNQTRKASEGTKWEF